LRRTLRLRHRGCFGSLSCFALGMLPRRSSSLGGFFARLLLVGAQRCFVLCVLLGSQLAVEVLRQPL
jgi:hypothetical protein